DESRQLSIGSHLKGKVKALSLQMYGCRVIQKALEVLPIKLKIQLMEELKEDQEKSKSPVVLTLVEDQNGNHVVQKAIETLPHPHLQFIVDSFREKVACMSCHVYGCRVIQRLLEYCPSSQIEFLLDEV